MEAKFNLWLEAEDEVVFSIWRMRLLLAVAETGSISAAAAQLGIQYRLAWQKIHEMETRLGEKLVDTQVGGRAGGGARLTAVAQDYVSRFSQFSQDVAHFVAAHYHLTFSDIGVQQGNLREV